MQNIYINNNYYYYLISYCGGGKASSGLYGFNLRVKYRNNYIGVTYIIFEPKNIIL